ncbi:BREX-1 system adenine-specific DNA-methyltransferase PglX [Loigolactobacillus coryniformis]|uniref:site-specific DNA-methyltransferase (adenine-specific) n=1 Tax=Loigolactobacillus coryniformis TaxID=1610 RepID=A0A5B8TDH3_9LACO|nr:BREX-1 system adenine-specific DNA-methyltransferase PglX [Loigolactobacillus coryniformis]QEA52487.1 BREX-1 system adenine-specific DNA-methyltransferase PglX [Loigolactobacillus coryniformis]
MDKAALKKFAVDAKQHLLNSIQAYARNHYLLNEQQLPVIEHHAGGSLLVFGDKRVQLSAVEENEFRHLLAKIQAFQHDSTLAEALAQLFEEVAFTWFNWLVALRYMELHDYLPIKMRILSSETTGKKEPDALSNIYDLVDDLALNTTILDSINDDAALTRSEKDIHLYQYLLKQQIKQLSQILPSVFYPVQGAESLLLPENLLQPQGIIADLLESEIPDEDWDNTEIIGWLFEYYNIEEKSKVGGLKNHSVSKHELPVVTQLFTPKWIVQYMLQNSLGNLYLGLHKETSLVGTWQYYLGHAGDLVLPNDIKQLEDIKIIDPACGSGHILIEAFRMLYEMYLQQGYLPREIPRTIIENNLFGLDIDKRSIQITQIVLLMEMLAKTPRLLRAQQPVVFSIFEFQDSLQPTTIEALQSVFDSTEIEQIRVLEQQFTDAKQFGSLLQPATVDWQAFTQKISELQPDQADLYQQAQVTELRERLLPLFQCAWLLTQHYDVVVTNPPYHNKYNPTLKQFMQQNYKDVKSDLYSAFIKETFLMTKPNGYAALMSPYTWMFISSHEKLRRFIINNGTIGSLVQLEYSAFEDATVPICTFVLQRQQVNTQGVFLRLESFKGAAAQPIKVAEAAADPTVGYRYVRDVYSFEDIPGAPIAYWASERVFSIFSNVPTLKNFGTAATGLQTGRGNFILFWSEVSIQDTNIQLNDRTKTWIKCNAGGELKKWYGNQNKIIKWVGDGHLIRNNPGAVIRNEKFYFRSGITWKRIGSSQLGLRILQPENIFDQAGDSLFVDSTSKRDYILAFMNSKAAEMFFRIISPTLNLTAGNIDKFPLIMEKQIENEVVKLSRQNITLSKSDWDAFETSWDFQQHPFLQYRTASNLLVDAFANWQTAAAQRFAQLKANEEELNRKFIDIYGLQDELSPEETDKEVTVRQADQGRDVRSFLSYLVGVIFGRYSLDEPGLIYAGGTFERTRYRQFQPDPDNVIPIGFAKGYYEDDIVTRIKQLLTLIFGAEYLMANLTFIANSLYPDNAQDPEEALRRYFLKDFYKDHLKIYQKRPIYWELSSGKQNGFKALIYLHRYTPTLLAQIRTAYLLPLMRTIDRLLTLTNTEVDSTRAKAAAEKQRANYQRQLTELRQYETVVQYMANRELVLDLDDGVKVNYAKFQNIEVPSEDGTKTQRLNILTKVKM